VEPPQALKTVYTGYVLKLEAMQRLTVEIPDEMDEMLESRKKKYGIDKTNQIRKAIANHLEL